MVFLYKLFFLFIFGTSIFSLYSSPLFKFLRFCTSSKNLKDSFSSRISLNSPNLSWVSFSSSLEGIFFFLSLFFLPLAPLSLPSLPPPSYNWSYFFCSSSPLFLLFLSSFSALLFLSFCSSSHLFLNGWDSLQRKYYSWVVL